MPNALNAEDGILKFKPEVQKKIFPKINIWKIDGRSLWFARYKLWYANKGIPSLPGRSRPVPARCQNDSEHAECGGVPSANRPNLV